ncbi:sucrose nonfermenting 4-like protein isoform X2 [Rhodamnia argentea]|uniref:Sucrose nonfermenting 4-like protein isoform X2 n=1 Tax=Rhodamnia argentea TaxID=178133 RepID=A0A8B8QER3_9MYRT|nr:sucrose nonfermenting 4-like protein isoform X2 [Rhodamnia argentea]
MDTARESGGIAGVILIPMRFVWPSGGTSVFLCGSFSRWSEFVPMSPVEGCTTVFQAICNIPPGYHQYKFLVDGEWRHDEHQPYATSDYGLVNTIFLTAEANYIPGTPSPDIPPVSNMEVDDHARRLVRITDGALIEAVPRISDTDLVVSRHRVSAFLTSHTAYELLPESGKVVALDIDLPVKQAFHILYEQGIPTAPLWDFRRGQFVGVLSAMDFILILRELGNHGSNLTEEELETHTIAAWKEGKAYLNRQIDGHGRAFSRPLVHAGPFDSLKDVTLKILQNDVASVPVIHSSSEDGSFPQLLHMASLSGILKCLCRYFRHCSSSLPVLQLPIYAIPIGTWIPKIGESNGRPLAMLRPSDSLSSALNLLIQAQVSSVPIVDDNDSLLDIYSRSDITALAKDKAYTHINLNEMTIHQAVQLGQDSYTPYDLRSQRCQMCLPSDSLHKVMERLANPGIRRLVIVEAGSKCVEGIVTLGDVFKFLLG